MIAPETIAYAVVRSFVERLLRSAPHIIALGANINSLPQVKQSSDSAQASLWAGLLGLVVIFSVAIMVVTIPLEMRLYRNIVEALSELGHRRVEVDVSGRDVRLSGRVASNQAGYLLKTQVAGLAGVRKVTASMVVDPVRFSNLVISRASDSIVIQGRLGRKEQIDQLQGLEPVQEKLIVDVVADVESSGETWLSALAGLLNATTEVSKMQMELGAHQLVISGSVTNDETYLQVKDEISEIIDSYRLKMVNRLAIVEQ